MMFIGLIIEIMLDLNFVLFAIYEAGRFFVSHLQHILTTESSRKKKFIAVEDH